MSIGSVGIDPRGDIRSVILLHLAGCSEVLSLKRYLGTDLSVPDFAATTVEFPENSKRWQVNMLFFDRLVSGVPIEVSPPRFEHLESVGYREDRTLGLVPVAPWSGKHWPAEKWQALISTLKARGWSPVTLCGPGQRTEAGTATGETLPTEECADLRAWASALQRCAAVVTLDSGPMHLADALGVPVFALFGVGMLPLWAPSGPRSRVIHHQEDRDFTLCHSIEKNSRIGRQFMNRITVEEVVRHLEAVFPKGPIR